MHDELFGKIKTQTFNHRGAILKIKYYNPESLIAQHIPIKEKVNKIEVFRMRNGYIIDTLTSVDIQEIVEIAGKVIRIYEGVIYCENFQKSPFREVIDKLFALRQKYKDESNEVVELLVKLLMNSLYGENIRRNNEENFACKSEYWMLSEYDERVKNCGTISHGFYIGLMIDDKGFADKVKKLNTKPLHLVSFVLSNSKKNMKNFIHAIGGYYTTDFFTEILIVYILKINIGMN